MPPLATSLCWLVRDRLGATAVVIGLSMTALMGFAGLAVDVGTWYADQRAAQGAADSAAYSGAIDSGAGDTASGVTAAAKAIAAQYGFTNGSGGVTVTVNMPPKSGSHTTTPGAVEVIVKKTETLLFASFFMNSASVSARAVGVAGSATSKYCVLALDGSASTSVSTADVSVSNGATIDTSTCGIQIDASGADALYMTGGARLLATTVSIVGSDSLSNGASISASGSLTTSAPSVADPYAGVTMPTPGACVAQNSFTAGGSRYTISPGTYCNGLTISNGVTVTMNPGVYIVNGGSFSLQGGSTVNASSGVTIVLTGSGSNYASAQIANGTTLNLTAPTSGATAGLAFFQDRQSTISATNSIAGGASFDVTGALYFPSQSVSYSNGTSNPSGCTQLIAWRISYTGGASFKNNCSGTGTTGIGTSATSLVE